MVTHQLTKLLHSLGAGARVLTFQPMSNIAVRATWFQLFALATLAVVASFVKQLVSVGLSGQFISYGLSYGLTLLPVLLFAAWAMARTAGNVQETLALAVLLCAAYVLLQCLTSTVPFFLHRYAEGRLSQLVSSYDYEVRAIWLTVAGLVATIRLFEMRTWRRWAVAAMAVMVIGVPIALIVQDPVLWMPQRSGDESEMLYQTQAGPANEDIFHLQSTLMDRELASLTPGRKGVVDLYWVGLAGYAPQDVFKREVESAAQLFKDRFGTAGHTVRLINNAKTMAELPIASVGNLRLALKRVGTMMDREEDVLFLFLTSHGSKNHHLSLEFWPLWFHDLDPQTLKQALDEAGIRRRVIVVSACYSGGFIGPLKNEDTLIISASAADKKSFGCSNEADFTYFGKAYFDQALRQTDSFIEAFNIAQRLVAERERAEQRDPSGPRIDVGSRIEEALSALNHTPPRTESKEDVTVYEDLAQLKLPVAVLDDYRKACMAEMHYQSPAQVVKKLPDAYSGMDRSPTDWSRLMVSWERYVEEYCAAVADPAVYRRQYAHAWRNAVTSSEAQAIVKFFRKPEGRKLLESEVAAARIVGLDMAQTRPALVEPINGRFVSERDSIFREFQSKGQSPQKPGGR